jgi:hypothetical protein
LRRGMGGGFAPEPLQQAHEETWHRLTPLVSEARGSLLDGLLISDSQTGRSLLSGTQLMGSSTTRSR